MSVVGFDDIAISRVSRIALTTVRQPALAMGRRAATIMVDHLESDAPEELGRYREIVEPELVIRRTTAPPPR
jgi:LacI family transcriptional regulator, galactose operon repressor